MQDMIQKVNKRLGFNDTHTTNHNITSLSFDDIMLMYKICIFQKGYHPEQVSTFCVAFDEDDLKVSFRILNFRNSQHKKDS